MKHFVITLVAVLFTFGMFVPDAEARRFGGGGSFGMQRQMSPPQSPRPAAQAPVRPGTQAAPNRSSWMGPIAGLAAGLGLAALFSHLGLGEGFASFVLIALMVFAGVMLFRFLARRALAGQQAQSAQRMQYAENAPGAFGGAAPASMAEMGGAASPVQQDDLRSQLDEAAFLRQAKLNFIRLQAANDRGDLADIREFTTPEVFAEIRMQMADAPTGPVQHTDVIDLDAEVLEVTEESGRYVVSVCFTGLLREEADSPPAHFDEIWHLVKEREGTSGWRVAGIQQAG